MLLSESIRPREKYFPEKVLQFGTGVLLRGLCDYLIDKANKNGYFEGSIVVVKSTGGGVSEFADQDYLYTCCNRGYEQGELKEENVVVSAISRVLSASENWEEILKTAENPAMQVIISNTTEVGLQYQAETFGTSATPESFPGKLTAWLLKRFETGLRGMVIVPTELVVDNGEVLKSLVLRHIDENKLGDGFRNWVEEANHFCSSLVDRIVPGKPASAELAQLFDTLGYEDKLLLKAETYRLWAIEGGEKIKDILSFYEADRGVVIEKNISQYRELKLRMLNAPHTLMCGLCYLSGFETVKEALNDSLMEKFITILMLTELAPALPESIHPKTVQRYGREIIDRFRNPYLDHRWQSIAFQYTMKMKMRAIPLLLNYYEVFGTVPHYFARGMAAYILFMKVVREKDGMYFGQLNGNEYPIHDDQAAWFFEVWQNEDSQQVVNSVLSNEEFWDLDLTHLGGFEESVATHLANMISIGVKEVASALNVFA